MAERLLICRPEQPVATHVPYAGMERLLTAEPKEAHFIPSDAINHYIDLDFGRPVTIDTVYLGYHNGVGVSTLWLQTLAGLGGEVTSHPLAGQIAAVGFGEPAQSAWQIPATVARFFRVAIFPNGQSFFAGVLAAGPSIAPIHGHEWDSGRIIEDTGSVERRLDGGFGIDDGVAAGGYEWSFDSLQPAEVATIYRWAKERRTTRSILVAEEGGGPGVFPSDCLHWGLFDKFERFSRRDPENTRWALRVRDWA